MKVKIRKQYELFNGQSGDKYGRLTLTGESYIKHSPTHRGRIVEAVCICGVVKNYWFHLLKSGETQSCGCYRKEVTSKRMTTHGLTKHPLYDVWQQMVLRCYNEKHPQFKDYGGRGIEVWKDWKEDFLEFYEWCLKNGYKEGLTLDRKDNDGFYSPQNCSFITHAEQNRNRRNNIIITAFGETKCLWDWAKDERCKVSCWGLMSRYKRGNWKDMGKMISSPNVDRKTVQRNNKRAKQFTAFGETKCQTEWLEDKRCLVKIDSFRDRITKGWSAEKAISFPPTRDGKNGYESSPLIKVGF